MNRQEYYDQLIGDLESRDPVAATSPAVKDIFAAVAAAAEADSNYVDWKAAQLQPETAEEAGLAVLAERKGIERYAASFASGTASINGEAGYSILAEVQLQSASGIIYISTAAASVGDELTIQAYEPGSASNLAVGTELTPLEPIAGINSVAVASIESGTDQEPLEEWRQRVIEAYRDDQRIGTVEDYYYWASQSPSGVAGAYAYDATPEAGYIRLYAYSDDPISPAVSSEQLASLETHIEDNRPAGVIVQYLSVTAQSVSVIISGVYSQDDRAAIAEQLDATILALRQSQEHELTVNAIHEVITSVTSSYELAEPTSSQTAAIGAALTISLNWL